MLLRSGKAQRALLSAIAAAGLLVGCGGGGSDINILPVTSDNSVDNSSTTKAPVETVNSCASYVNEAGQTLQGEFNLPNCSYPVFFADAGNNVTTDLTIPALENGGAHMFDGSLFIGEAHSNDAELTAPTITAAGTDATYIGAITDGVTNPYEGWTVGIFEADAEPLWFE